MTEDELLDTMLGIANDPKYQERLVSEFQAGRIPVSTRNMLLSWARQSDDSERRRWVRSSVGEDAECFPHVSSLDHHLYAFVIANNSRAFQSLHQQWMHELPHERHLPWSVH